MIPDVFFVQVHLKHFESFEVQAANDKAEGVGLFQSGQYFKSYQAGPLVLPSESLHGNQFRSLSLFFFSGLSILSVVWVLKQERHDLDLTPGFLHF